MSTAEVDSLRARALKLLSQREHSRRELELKLGRDAAPTAVAELLDDLAARGWLSDERFAQAYVSAKQSRYGAHRLAAELGRRGVDAEQIAAALGETDDELARARAVWQKKFGCQPADVRERAKQARFLATRGFTFDVIRRLLGDLDPAD